MHILRCMGSKFCVKFQRAPLKFHTKFWTHTPQNVHFTVMYFCLWVRISSNCDVISLSETGLRKVPQAHYYDVRMGAIASQITSLTIVHSTVYPDADQSRHQSSASLAFVWELHRGPVNFPHKWPVTRKMFPFDDVIMFAYMQGKRKSYGTRAQGVLLSSTG